MKMFRFDRVPVEMKSEDYNGAGRVNVMRINIGKNEWNVSPTSNA